MLNLDRNECNILVTSKHAYCDADSCAHSDEGNSCWSLVPIDHGLSIPDSLAVSSYEIAWMGYSAAEVPFSAETLKYIEAIDVEGDIRMLQERLPFRLECLRNMRISTTLLKVGARMGLTLAQIGELLCRPDMDDAELSPLE